jgi:ElaB/YqjD/DUF883 family membrane-anchored ribosome-binding protein
MGQRAGDIEAKESISGPRIDEDEDVAESTLAAREQIEITRVEMSGTIDAIQDKLDPEVLSEQAKGTAHDVTDYAIREAKEAAREITDHAVAQARQAVQDITGQAKLAVRDATVGKVETMARTASETAGGWRQSMLDTIKANPMPAALVGLGLGWMFVNRPGGSPARGSAAGYGPRPYTPDAYGPGAYGGQPYSLGSAEPGLGASRAAHTPQDKLGRVAVQAQQAATGAVEQVQGTAGDAFEQVQDAGERVVDQVQEQAHRAEGFVQRQIQENPLLVGAVAVAIGGVLGAMVRSTSREDQLLGDTRDRLLGTASEFTQETMDKVGHVVQQAQESAKEEAADQKLIPEGGVTSSAR